MKKKRYMPYSKGFTLIEVLMALAIFSIGAMGIFAMQVNAISTSARARRLAVATELTQFPIEAFKGASFRSLDNIRQKIDGLPLTFEYITTTDGPTFVNSINYSGTKSNGDPDNIPVLDNAIIKWYSLFISSGNDDDLHFRGKGTMTITLNRENGVNVSADVFVKVEWCDNKPDVDDCEVKHLHKVESEQSFTNND